MLDIIKFIESLGYYQHREFEGAIDLYHSSYLTHKTRIDNFPMFTVYFNEETKEFHCAEYNEFDYIFPLTNLCGNLKYKHGKKLTKLSWRQAELDSRVALTINAIRTFLAQDKIDIAFNIFYDENYILAK